MLDAICAIAGVPRSGTSWLGMLVDSSPSVNYRFQPLFAYAFKNSVSVDSTPAEFESLMQRMDTTEDEFLLQSDKRSAGYYPTFEKDSPTTCLAFKTCRYQYVLPSMLRSLPQLKLVGIIRNPCGAIHSWLSHPKEFPTAADPKLEWRFGACKNQGHEEEFFGFYKWREIAHLYQDLVCKYPDRAMIVQYEELVRNTLEETQRLFRFLGLPVTDQTIEFVEACHARHDDNPYAVFKARSVAERWQHELDPTIRDSILREVEGTRLETFLK